MGADFRFACAECDFGCANDDWDTYQNLILKNKPENKTQRKEKKQMQEEKIAKVNIPNTKNGVLDLATLIFRFTDGLYCNGIFTDIVEVHFAGGVYFLMSLSTEYEAKNQSKIVKRLAYIPIKKLRAMTVRNFLENSYKMMTRQNSYKIAVKTYLNMQKKRRKSKNGKELYRYIKSHAEYIIEMLIRKKDVKNLGQVLELQLLPQKNLRNIFFLKCQNKPPEVKACLMDALKKTKKKAENDLEM